MQTNEIDTKVESLIRQMTLEEKVSLCHGASSFATKAIPRLGIPEFRFTDGPNGVRDEEGIPTTSFPTGISMASSWDPALVHRVAAAMGEECKALGKSVLLAPAVNIDRTPLGGRTFEYFSEDPYLNSELAVGYIQGVQSAGVLACVKHFAANSIETERMTVDARVDERTLREIYLPTFEASVKRGKVGSIMSAYNKLNGPYCSESKFLLKAILKDEWGFKGFVMSDWGAVHSTVPTALAGMDLEMPGDDHNFLGEPLLEAVRHGEVPESEIDDKVRRILRTLYPVELPSPVQAGTPSNSVNQTIARELAEQSMVLLKNDRHVLPLNKQHVGKVALIRGVRTSKLGYGGGSGSVLAPSDVSLQDGIRSYLGPGAHLQDVDATPPLYGGGAIVPASALSTASGEPGLDAEYFDNVKFEGAARVKRVDSHIDFSWPKGDPAPGVARENFSVRWTGFITAEQTGDYVIGTSSDDGSTVAIDGKLVVDNNGYHSEEYRSGTVHLLKGRKTPIEVRFFQGTGDAEMHLLWHAVSSSKGKPWIDNAVTVAKSADTAVLFVGIDYSYDGEGHDKPNMKLLGDQDELVRKVLAVNPRTVIVLVNGSPVELPWAAKAETILEAWYPGMEAGNALARVLFGDVNPSGKLPVTFPKKLQDSPAHANGDYSPKTGVLNYSEGIFIGYRYFDSKKVRPLFAFGHGLSYTTFRYSDLKVSSDRVSVVVTNSGAAAGAEVVQCYIGKPNSQVLRAAKELKSFCKVFLVPGESKRVEMPLDSRAFSYWSTAKHAWEVEPGDYEVLVGSSSRDIRLKGRIER